MFSFLFFPTLPSSLPPSLPPGYAIGGGHILHMLCDLTICADNVVFGQTGPTVGREGGREGRDLLHMLCDLTICADNANVVFGQTGPRVGR